MSKQSWDIIATASAGPDAAWFAFHLAHSLSRHRGVQVTLYLDELDSLAQQVPGVSPARSEQFVNSFRLRAHSRLNTCEPSHHCLVIFDSIMPLAYLLMRQRTSCSPWHFFLPRLGVDSVGRNDWHAAGIPAIELWSGTTELGFIKPNANTFKQPEKRLPHRRSPYLAACDAQSGQQRVAVERVVTVLPNEHTDLAHWVLAWLQSPWPVRVQMPQASLLDSAFSGMWQQGSDLVAGPLTVSPLPALSWRDMDDILGSSDLVISSRQDIAIRAMASGTPVATPLTGQLLLDRGRPQHHAMALLTPPVDHVAEQGVADLATAWSLNHHEAESWRALCRCWDGMQTNAKAVAHEFQQLPDLADSLLGLAGAQPFRYRDFGTQQLFAEH